MAHTHAKKTKVKPQLTQKTERKHTDGHDLSLTIAANAVVNKHYAGTPKVVDDVCLFAPSCNNAPWKEHSRVSQTGSCWPLTDRVSQAGGVCGTGRRLTCLPPRTVIIAAIRTFSLPASLVAMDTVRCRCSRSLRVNNSLQPRAPASLVTSVPDLTESGPFALTRM